MTEFQKHSQVTCHPNLNPEKKPKTQKKPNISFSSSVLNFLLPLPLISLSKFENAKKNKNQITMESILINCVQNNLHHFMHSNAIFISQLLCAQFPSEVLLLHSSLHYFFFSIFSYFFCSFPKPNRKTSSIA